MESKTSWIEQVTGDWVGVEVIGREVVDGFIERVII